MKRALLALVVVAGCTSGTSITDTPGATTSPTPKVIRVPDAEAIIPIHCHAIKVEGVEDGWLPDHKCTPGIIDARVTQANIHSTICVKGYTATVRPDAGYTNKLKISQIAQYGYADTDPGDYEEDHLISLELGGDPEAPKNLWPEPGGSPNAKDTVENELHARVCDGTMTLTAAQRIISGDWTRYQGG